ncbi:hypothetical protein BKA67DRAFT_665481 [Truncatella angustata]|uniref:DUF218 domain-containing protein n=1 Tax=Truncatella angustata TaxID=152316 RepID=A0A9P8UB18_9PEZI|nr:uncharacterized protein BKA67DRAFT_665481 [Truncatella angustata]KAH6638527.1 hypothetical protein BKA67DRAFT_665481 [Truncatella angustata]
MSTNHSMIQELSLTKRMSSLVSAINAVSSFLAGEQIRNAADLIDQLQPVPAGQVSAETDVIVFCASAALYTAEAVFSAVQQLQKERGTQLQQGTIANNHVVLVLCGGIGHSTHHIHKAVSRHPKFKGISDRVQGQPEARVLQAIFEQFFGLAADGNSSLSMLESSPDSDKTETIKVLIEDKSTNCGANASLSKKLLEEHAISNPRSIIVAQDPTMCRRTAASFEKLYEHDPKTKPRITCWPTFVPRVQLVDSLAMGCANVDPLSLLSFDTSAMTASSVHDLWDMARFADLVMGEIPRLRDDSKGYGPHGKGFIAHVDLPQHVEEAWKTLRASLGTTDRAGHK